MSSFAFDLIGMGNAPVDAICSVSEQFLIDNNIKKSYLSVIDAAERDRLAAQLNDVTYIPGGGSANVCTMLSAVGGKAAFQSRIGADDRGALFTQSLNDLRVSTDGMAVDKNHDTAMLYAFITPDKDRTFAACYGAAEYFCADDIDIAQVQAAKALYIDGFGLVAPDCFEAYKRAIEGANQVFFCVSDPSVIETHREKIDYLVARADRVFMNGLEAQVLTGEQSLERAMNTLLEQNITAVITMAHEGVYILNPAGNEAKYYNIQAIDEREIVNMNGAGDSFAGGYLYGFLNGWDDARSVKLGRDCAVEVIKTSGPRPQKSLERLAA